MSAPHPLRIGLVFELVGSLPRHPDHPPDADAEYETEQTVALLEAAVRELGHVPVRLGGPRDLLAAAGKGRIPPVDAVLDISEGYGSRNREAWAPVLLEMAGLPVLGSDALTRSLCLDKAWAKRIAAAAGIPTPPFAVFAAAGEVVEERLPGPFPLFVKPRHEGTSKGIRRSSRVGSLAELRREVARVAGLYRQPALVETFLPGAEFTVTVVGHDPPRALPALQRALEAGSRIGVHALVRRGGEGAPPGHWLELPGELTPDLEDRLAQRSLALFGLFECLDFARVDYRLDAAGEPSFLEINPLPTFAPDGSFGILAELEGRRPEELVAEVVAGGLRRLGLA